MSISIFNELINFFDFLDFVNSPIPSISSFLSISSFPSFFFQFRRFHFDLFQVLEVDNDTLSKIYKPLGRCIAIIDDKVFDIYGTEIKNYFAHHDITFKPLIYKGNEVDKEIGNVETILVDLKTYGVSRNEPVLIMGGGVISDIGGFACGLYHRSTPYVMLCTSIVSGMISIIAIFTIFIAVFSAILLINLELRGVFNSRNFLAIHIL